MLRYISQQPINTMNRILVLIVIFSFTGFNKIWSQRFKAAAIIGTNLSQIDGDNLYGFKKIGLTAGGRLSYANEKTLDVALEMLYSQRGSAVNFFNNTDQEKIKLNYLEIPIVLSLRDWYIEKDGYYKVRAEGGLSYGYLFGAGATGFDVSVLKNHDISWLLGIGLNVNKKLGFALRYTSSFTDMYNDPADVVTFKSYFITFRTEINF